MAVRAFSESRDSNLKVAPATAFAARLPRQTHFVDAGMVDPGQRFGDRAGVFRGSLHRHHCGRDDLRQRRRCAAAPACPRVFVRRPAQQTDFARGFHSALITAPLRHKVAVSHAPAGAISLDIDIQTVRFSPNRPDARFLPLSVLYAGGWAAYGVAKHAAPAAAGLAGAALAGGIDVYRWNTSDWASGPTPQTELIVTVSASDAKRYLGRVSNVYYVADRDASLYVGPPQLYDIAVGGDR
ncbi:MAG: hypothetical protein AW08_01027 [Candidatus Accumulibacter adjunctus]|uniref:Uncharacterized protein n=1 Tax=Candidatus Accumulibacter adjunctus TaxID=1454001 RepID=A0A011NVR5_9PROT|nr:MAG: hypothetical protein AW08_01027 [Candidatus Accumulibacter adjunctus]